MDNSVTVDPGPTAASGTLVLGHGESENVTSLLDALATPGLADDVLTLTAVSAENGVASVADGVATYVAPASGSDVISYTVADQLGDAATGSVAVTVDPGPDVSNGTLSIGYGQSENIDGLLTSLVAPGEAGDLETRLDVLASKGSIALANGQVMYTAPVSGTDTITFVYEDQYGDQATGAISVTTHTPSLTVAEALASAGSSYPFAIVDTAADVVANLDAINSDVASVTSIALTDPSTPNLSLSIAQALSDGVLLGKITTPYSVTIADTPANIAAIGSAQASALRSAGYADIAATAAVTLTLAEASLLASNTLTVTGGVVTVSGAVSAMLALGSAQDSGYIANGYILAVQDTAAHIDALTTAQIALLGTLHVSQVTASDATLKLSLAQANAFVAAHIILSAPAGSTIEIADTAVNLRSLTTSQIAALSAAGVLKLVASNGNLAFSVAQVTAMEGAQLAASDLGGYVSLTDTAVDIASLSTVQIAGLAAIGVSTIVPLNSIVTVDAAQALAFAGTGVKFSYPGAGHMTVSDSAANVSALSASQIASLSGIGVRSIAATGSGVTLSVAQVLALEAGGIAVTAPNGSSGGLASEPVIVSDTAGALSTLTSTQIAGLTNLHVAGLVATDANWSLTASEAQELAKEKISVSSPAPSNAKLVIVVTLGQSLTQGTTATRSILSNGPEYPNNVLALNFNSSFYSMNGGWTTNPVNASTFVGLTPMYETNSETQLTSLLNTVVSDYDNAGETAPTLLNINTGMGSRSILQLMTPSSDIFSSYSTALSDTTSGEEFAVTSTKGTYDFYVRTSSGATFYENLAGPLDFFDNLTQQVEIAVQNADAQGYQVSPTIVFNYEQGQADLGGLASANYESLLSELFSRVEGVAQSDLGSAASVDGMVTQVRGVTTSAEQLNFALTNPNTVLGATEYPFEAEYPSQVGVDYTHLSPQGYYMLGQTQGNQLFDLLNGDNAAPITISSVTQASPTTLTVNFSGVRTYLVNDQSIYRAGDLLTPPPNMGFGVYTMSGAPSTAFHIDSAAIVGAESVELQLSAAPTGAFRIYLGQTQDDLLTSSSGGLDTFFNGATLRDASTIAPLTPADGQTLSDPSVYDFAPIQYVDVVSGATSMADALVVVADQYSVDGAATILPGTAPFISDSGSKLETLTVSQIDELTAFGFTKFASTGAVAFSVAQGSAFAAVNAILTAPSGSKVTISDGAANVTALSATQIAALASIGVTGVTASGGNVTLTAAQAAALEAARLTLAVSSGFAVTISDSAAALTALSATQLSGLTALHATKLVATDVGATLSVAQAEALETGKIAFAAPSGLANALDDTAANLATLTTTQIAGLAGLGVTTAASTDVGLSLGKAQALAFLSAGVRLSAPSGDAVTVSDTAANLQALTAAQITSLASVGVGGFTSTNNNVSFAAAQTSAILAAGLTLSAAGAYTVTENFANGGYSTFENGTLMTQKSVNIDRSYDIEHLDVKGLGYSSYETLFSASGVNVADAEDMTDGSGTLILSGSGGLTISLSSGAQSVTTGVDTFVIDAHSTESITASGTTGDAFLYSSGFGQDTINGFAATGASHDTLQFSASMFNYLTSGMTQAQDVAAVLGNATHVGSVTTISDTAGDSLTLNGETIGTLTANPNDFRFV